MEDYGTINVSFHPGLTYDQKATIVKQSVCNQLLTTNRKHYIEILDDCTEMSNILEDLPIIIRRFEDGYTYVFKLDIISSLT